MQETKSAEQTFSSKAVAKRTAITTSKTALRKLIGQIKSHDIYTEAIGMDLGVIGAEVNLTQEEINTAKPKVVATIVGNYIIFDWLKRMFDGVAIYRKRGNETTFTLIGRDTFSPFEDAIGNITEGASEVRIYKFIYILDDKEIGLFSDEIKVAV